MLSMFSEMTPERAILLCLGAAVVLMMACGLMLVAIKLLKFAGDKLCLQILRVRRLAFLRYWVSNMEASGVMAPDVYYRELVKKHGKPTTLAESEMINQEWERFNSHVDLAKELNAALTECQVLRERLAIYDPKTS